MAQSEPTRWSQEPLRLILYLYVVNYRRLDGTLEAPEYRDVDHLFADLHADCINYSAVAVG